MLMLLFVSGKANLFEKSQYGMLVLENETISTKLTNILS